MATTPIVPPAEALAKYIEPSSKAVQVTQFNESATATRPLLLEPLASSVATFDANRNPGTTQLSAFASQADIAIAQADIQALKDMSYVAVIVSAYADLQAVDKSKLTANDYAKVLKDETHGGKVSWYQLNASKTAWVYKVSEDSSGGLPDGGNADDLIVNTGPGTGEWMPPVPNITQEPNTQSQMGMDARWTFTKAKKIFAGDDTRPAFRISVVPEFISAMRMDIFSIGLLMPDGITVVTNDVQQSLTKSVTNAGLPLDFDFKLTDSAYANLLNVPFITCSIHYFVDQTIVRDAPENSFLTVIESGALPLATESSYGIVHLDGITIGLDKDGKLTVKRLPYIGLSGSNLSPSIDRYHYATLSGTMTITLPPVADDDKNHHEIWIEASVSGTPTVNLGTTRFINEAPTLTAGLWTLGYVWQITGRMWALGWYKNVS